jgi:hypothetical protein
MTDEEFIAALENCQLPASQFNHAAHVRAGYLYLRRQKFAHALSRLCTSICQYAQSLGKSGLYHETITVAFLALINERLYQRGDGGGWEGFARANADLLRKDALLSLYPQTVLDSTEARARFVLPSGERSAQFLGRPAN